MRRVLFAVLLVLGLPLWLVAQAQLTPAFGTAPTLNALTSYQNNGVLLCGSAAPTISSGFGTSPSILNSNGSCTFRVDVGTGGAATSGVVGLSTASTGWNCQVTDLTNNTVTRETASSTTTVTVTAAAAWAAGDDLIFTCTAY